MEYSQRLALPLILPGQNQKELFHNEALQALDILVAGAVEEEPRNDPPASPVIGTCFIVGSTPTGEWTGKAGSIAGFTAGGWRHLVAVEGMTVWVKSSTSFAVHAEGAWEIGELRGSRLVIGGQDVVGEQGAAIPDVSGGSVIDVEARACIAAIVDRLRSHGLIKAS